MQSLTSPYVTGDLAHLFHSTAWPGLNPLLCGWWSVATGDWKKINNAFSQSESNAPSLIHCWKQSVLTTPEAHVYPHAGIWETLFAQANVYVQWDPERSINGKKLEHRSLQLGISRNLISQFNEDAIVAIDDLTPLVRKCHNLLINGKTTQAKSFLPPEKIYPVSAAARKALGMKNSWDKYAPI